MKSGDRPSTVFLDRDRHQDTCDRPCLKPQSWCDLKNCIDGELEVDCGNVPYGVGDRTCYAA
ncbi:MAG: hypothetical protein IGR76_02615 [Synechococcales cyanobacterium T60_A2020_003]|nr:hypothetical protein [Synechococcales cyanobacterium T60_A2020_003]